MKKLIPKIYALFLVLGIGLILSTKTAHAQSVIKLLGYESLSIFIAEGLANILNNVQMIVSWILALSGFLLNYSINLTLQLKAFLDQTPAIFTTWKAIRDISGLFIIFFLLFAALKLILGLGTKFGDLIKNIVIAGVLINFSFFFAGLGIDASNIVSIQLYNAIAPANSLNIGNLQPDGLVNRTVAGTQDGGLSDIFMKSLKIPALYDTNGKVSPAGETAAAGGAWTAPIKILLVGFASIIVMLTATLSFAAAAIAFIVRFVVLIFLLAFSPIWFASHIIPEIGSYAKKFTEVYKGMLVFMPVYLLLMYLALNVMTTTPILSGGSIAAATTAAAAGDTANWYSSIIAVLINAIIVIVLINVPLIAAISVSGGVLKFINVDKIGAWGVLGGAKRVAGLSYQNTIGRGASAIARSESLKNVASKNSLAGATLRSIRGVATPYEAKLANQVKERTEFAGSLGYNKKQVAFHEIELRDLQRQQSILRSRGDSDGAKSLDSKISQIKAKIEETKNVRQLNYAEDINTPQVDTIWTKVARKNKTAASKIEGEIIKKQLESAKKDFDKVQEKINDTRKKIDSIKQSIDSGITRDEAKAKDSINNLEKEIPAMHDKESKSLEKINELEARLEKYS